MMPDQSKLARLQLGGMLATVFTLVITLASYYLYQHWQDYLRQRTQHEAQLAQSSRVFLHAYSSQAVEMLSAQAARRDELLRSQLQEQVDSAYLIANQLYRSGRQRLSPAALQQQIVATLRPLRFFSGRGYFFIHTRAGRCVLLPILPQLEGKPLHAIRDDTGRPVMQELLDSVANPEGRGFSRYRWYMPGSSSLMQDKISYSRVFAPYGWLIGAGEYPHNVTLAQQGEALATLARMRFGRDGRFLVFDDSGTVRLFDAAPGYVGRQPYDQPPALRTLLSLLRQNSRQQGLVSFSLRTPQGTQTQLAVAQRMDAWGWTVVAMAPRDELAPPGADRAVLLDELGQRLSATLLIFLAALCGGAVFSWYFARWMQALGARFRADLQRKQHELDAQERAIQLTLFMVDNSADAVVLLDNQSSQVYANQAAWSQLPGHGALQLEALLPPDDHPLPYHGERRLPDGDTVFDVSVTELLYEGERYRCLIARDVSREVADQASLRLAARVFESSNEAILICDAANRILAANHTFSRITDYQEDEVRGSDPRLLASGHHDGAFFHRMWQALEQHGQWSGEIWNRRKHGSLYPAWLNISMLHDGNGQVSHYIAMFTDITERKEAEERVRHLAEYDFLTDLPNRMLLARRLEEALAVAVERSQRVGVLFADLDRFKNINDTLGHHCGDELLKQAAQRMQGCVRALDTVARTGGDEFVVLLPGLEHPDEAAHIAERLLQALRQPFLLQGHELVVTPSMGISLYPDDGHDANTLLMHADLALYHTKENGRNGYRFFDTALTGQASERLYLEHRLREALQRHAFELYLQPQYHLQSQHLHGFEALLRWRGDDGCMVPPARFIPVAEDSGMIVELGGWVLDEACRIAASWDAPLRIAVNASAKQLAGDDFVARVEAALARHGLDAQRLEVEVTESVLLDGSGAAIPQLAALKAMGVRLAIDDFGTGYSSLSYLKRFAPNVVKIDRSFVMDLDHDQEDHAIVSAIITLARTLNMSTLAEGVETDAQRRLLAELGCDMMQGFLLGHPMPEAEARALIRGMQGEVVA